MANDGVFTLGVRFDEKAIDAELNSMISRIQKSGNEVELKAVFDDKDIQRKVKEINNLMNGALKGLNTSNYFKNFLKDIEEAQGDSTALTAAVDKLSGSMKNLASIPVKKRDLLSELNSRELQAYVNKYEELIDLQEKATKIQSVEDYVSKSNNRIKNNVSNRNFSKALNNRYIQSDEDTKAFANATMFSGYGDLKNRLSENGITGVSTKQLQSLLSNEYYFNEIQKQIEKLKEKQNKTTDDWKELLNLQEESAALYKKYFSEDAYDNTVQGNAQRSAVKNLSSYKAISSFGETMQSQLKETINGLINSSGSGIGEAIQNVQDEMKALIEKALDRSYSRLGGIKTRLNETYGDGTALNGSEITNNAKLLNKITSEADGSIQSIDRLITELKQMDNVDGIEDLIAQLEKLSSEFKSVKDSAEDVDAIRNAQSIFDKFNDIDTSAFEKAKTLLKDSEIEFGSVGNGDVAQTEFDKINNELEETKVKLKEAEERASSFENQFKELNNIVESFGGISRIESLEHKLKNSRDISDSFFNSLESLRGRLESFGGIEGVSKMKKDFESAKEEISELQQKLEASEISKNEYFEQLKTIEEKYSKSLSGLKSLLGDGSFAEFANNSSVEKTNSSLEETLKIVKEVIAEFKTLGEYFSNNDTVSSMSKLNENLRVTKEETKEAAKAVDAIDDSSSTKNLNNDFSQLMQKIDSLVDSITSISKAIGSIDDGGNVENITQKFDKLLDKMKEVNTSLASGEINLNFGSSLESSAADAQYEQYLKNISNKWERWYQQYNQVKQKSMSGIKTGNKENTFLDRIGGAATKLGLIGSEDAFIDRFSAVSIGEIQSTEEKVKRISELFKIIREVFSASQDSFSNATSLKGYKEYFDLYEELNEIASKATKDPVSAMNAKKRSIYSPKTTSSDTANSVKEALTNSLNNGTASISANITGDLDKVQSEINSTSFEPFFKQVENLSEAIKKFSDMLDGLNSSGLEKLVADLNSLDLANTFGKFEIGEKSIEEINQATLKLNTTLLDTNQKISDTIAKYRNLQAVINFNSSNKKNSTSTALPENTKSVTDAYEYLIKIQEKYLKLKHKADQENITPEESGELAKLIDQREKYISILEKNETMLKKYNEAEEEAKRLAEVGFNAEDEARAAMESAKQQEKNAKALKEYIANYEELAKIENQIAENNAKLDVNGSNKIIEKQNASLTEKASKLKESIANTSQEVQVMKEATTAVEEYNKAKKESEINTAQLKQELYIEKDKADNIEKTVNRHKELTKAQKEYYSLKTKIDTKQYGSDDEKASLEKQLTEARKRIEELKERLNTSLAAQVVSNEPSVLSAKASYEDAVSGFKDDNLFANRKMEIAEQKRQVSEYISVLNELYDTQKQIQLKGKMRTITSDPKELENISDELSKLESKASSLEHARSFMESFVKETAEGAAATDNFTKKMSDLGKVVDSEFSHISEAKDLKSRMDALAEVGKVRQALTNSLSTNGSDFASSKITESLDTMAIKINNITDDARRLDTINEIFTELGVSVDKFSTKLIKIDTNRFPDAEADVNKLKTSLEELQLLTGNAIGENLISNSTLSRLKEVISDIDEVGIKIKNTTKMASEVSVNKMSGKIASFLNDITGASDEAKIGMRELQDQIDMLGKSGGVSASGLSNIAAKYEEIVAQTKAAGQYGKSFMDTLTTRAKSMSASFFAMYFSFYDIIRYVRNFTSTITEYDSALTEMRKVSDESVSSLKEYQNQTFAVADAIGSTAKDIQNSTADWLRLGESLTEASESAKDATILMNVSEFDSIDDATESLVSMSQAYTDLSKMDIIDKLNLIGKVYCLLVQ